MCMFTCGCLHVCGHEQHTCGGQNFLRLFSLFHHMGCKDWIQVVRLGGKHCYPLSHFASPRGQLWGSVPCVRKGFSNCLCYCLCYLCLCHTPWALWRFSCLHLPDSYGDTGISDAFFRISYLDISGMESRIFWVAIVSSFSHWVVSLAHD